MLLTVAICTWNRSALLRETLESLCRLRIPEALSWEVLVVNNQCTDTTDDVMASFASRLPLQRVNEPKRGLSRARNAAVARASGDYILWTDDDVLVESGWLEAYVAAFRRWPDAVFFGGPVLPFFEAPLPPWLEAVWARVSHAYGMRDVGQVPFRIMEPIDLPYGANYAVRRKEQQRYLYESRFGHHGLQRIGGEETTLLAQLLSEGSEGHWIPEAKVCHRVTPERMTIRYLRHYHVGHGRFLARAHDLPMHRRRGLRKVKQVVRTLKTALVKEAGYRYQRVAGTPDKWVGELMESSIAWGRLLG